MSDFSPNYPSTETLEKMKRDAFFFIISGIVLIICTLTMGKPPLAIAAGVIIGAVGIGWLLASNPQNKKTGAIVVVVGGLIILAGARLPVFRFLVPVLLFAGSFGLLAKGVITYFQYLAINK